jgi:hypothetical protein
VSAYRMRLAGWIVAHNIDSVRGRITSRGQALVTLVGLLSSTRKEAHA